MPDSTETCPNRMPPIAQRAVRLVMYIPAWHSEHPSPLAEHVSSQPGQERKKEKKKRSAPTFARSPRVRSAPFPEGRRVGCITSRHFLVSVGSLAANVVGNRLLQPPWEWLSDLSKTQRSWQKSPAGNAAESDWRRRRRRRRRWRAYVCLWPGRRGVTRGYIAEARDGSRGAHVE